MALLVGRPTTPLLCVRGLLRAQIWDTRDLSKMTMHFVKRDRDPQGLIATSLRVCVTPETTRQDIEIV